MEQMVLLYPKLQKFSKNVMDALGEKVHRQSLESTNALLEQNKKNRELVQSSEMDEKDKQELLASIDKMDEFIRDPLKNKDWLTDFSTVTISVKKLFSGEEYVSQTVTFGWVSTTSISLSTIALPVESL